MNGNAQQSLTDRYNIISLGSFCSVAMELERVGLRNGSFPFDWIISGDFKSVLEMIENHFKGFVDRENLFQEFDICPAYYYNKACNVHFYHDFPHIKVSNNSMALLKKNTCAV